MTDETPLSEYTSVTRRWGRISVRVLPDELEIATERSGNRAKAFVSYKHLLLDRTEGEFHESDPSLAWPIGILCAFVAGGLCSLAGFEPPGAIFVGVIALPIGFASARRNIVRWVSFAWSGDRRCNFDATVVSRPSHNGEDPEFDRVVADIAARIRAAHPVPSATPVTDPLS